jgi:energy-coupling factor transporter transmembrane protein EcfT
MKTHWHDLWGCGRGPVIRLVPQTRILLGGAAFATCMIAPATTVAGGLLFAGTVAVWLIASRPPMKTVFGFALLGLLLFVPTFLLLPLLPFDGVSAANGWRHAFVVSADILMRGMSGVLISMATVASVTVSDLREGLTQLPLPGIVSAIVVQIVHQTASLFYETKRVASAMAVRGASGGGRAAWQVLWSLPRVWLPRIVDRADRVADAMELRGYCDGETRTLRSRRMRAADWAALALALAVLGLAVLIRVRGVA